MKFSFLVDEVRQMLPSEVRQGYHFFLWWLGACPPP